MGKYFYFDNSFERKDFSNEVSGMTKKAFPNLQKLSIIYACSRETMSFLSTDEEPDVKNPVVEFKVTKVDVEAGWEIMMQSMLTYKSFKVRFHLAVSFKSYCFDNL